MWKHFRTPLAVNAIALVLTTVFFGWTGAITVLILTVLEVTFSFDNAIVNAKVLKRMTPKWKTLFLTVGILIAVFGMRLLFPLLVVSITGHITPWAALHLAVAHPDQYARHLLSAHASIAAFGGIFLLMLWLDWLQGEKDHNWIRIERWFENNPLAYRLPVVLAILLLPANAIWAGVAGAATYLAVSRLDSLFERFKFASAGLASFLYLEALDASFSFDGVIGAFAVSSNIFLIMIGLGIGAAYVRSLTVYLTDKGTLANYRYLEHGAHWAIGTLALFLLISVTIEVPDILTGLVGVAIITTSFIHSVKLNKKELA